MTSSVLERERVPLTVAALAVLVSAVLRAPWFLLVLIMPRSATGAVLFYLVVASAGIVLLHWCLSWFRWTISFRAALGARAVPGLVAAVLAGLLGFHASLPGVLVLGGIEVLLGVFIVAVCATRPEGQVFGTAFDEGDLLWLVSDGVKSGSDTDPEDRYSQDVASLVRDARAVRFG